MYDLEKMDGVAASLDSFERDCAITVALKISDDSCKMDEYEKSIFMALYDALPEQTTEFFQSSVFDTIFLSRNNPSAQTYSEIKKLRESAMEMITRPRMKAFKAQVRQGIAR